MAASTFETAMEACNFRASESGEFSAPGEVSLVIDPSITFQEFMGFGTSFTERPLPDGRCLFLGGTMVPQRF